MKRRAPNPYPAELLACRGNAALIVDGKRVCVDCKTPILPMRSFSQLGVARRCRPCNETRHQFMHYTRGVAANAVAKAKKDGLLKPANLFACVDCGKPATEYDHRDYTKPLDVVPVCRKCNFKRGPADVWTAAKAEA